MNSSEQGETRNLKLPSIVESIVQQEQSERYFFNKSDVQNFHQAPAGRGHRAIDDDRVEARIMERLGITKRDARYESLTIVPEHTRSFHQTPSPDSEIRFSNVDEGHSTSRSSPYNELSQDRINSSRSTTPSSTGESNVQKDARTGFILDIDVMGELTKILTSSPPEIANRAEKHKLDERRRRDEHKQLQKLLENMCSDMLDHLQSSNFESHWDDLVPQLTQAMTTGNHKKHHTKTAVLLTAIMSLVDQKKGNQTLRRENSWLRGKLRSHGINLSEVSGIGTPSFTANKRRRSSLVVKFEGGDSFSKPSDVSFR